MWVLHICHSYYPPFLDCARQYAALFKGIDYQVVTVFLTGKPDAEIAAGVGYGEVHFLGFDSKEVGGLKLSAIAKIRALHKKYQFKFCIAHRVKPTYVALLATDIPVVSVHHNYKDYSRWSRRLLVNFYKNRLLMLGVSNSVRDDLRCDLKGWPQARIQTLYNRIDVEAVRATFKSKTQARLALNIPQDAWVVGTAGRLHHDKDYPTLLRGFAKALPNLPQNSLLVIMGKGSLEAELKALSDELGLQNHVKFMGFVAEGASYFKAFDVFALTSNHEPFGMVLLEAMAAEVPIICSDCGGGAEVVRDAGSLFGFGDIDALAKTLASQANSDAGKIIANQLNKLNENFTDAVAKKRFFEDCWTKLEYQERA